MNLIYLLNAVVAVVELTNTIVVVVRFVSKRVTYYRRNIRVKRKKH